MRCDAMVAGTLYVVGGGRALRIALRARLLALTLRTVAVVLRQQATVALLWRDRIAECLLTKYKCHLAVIIA
jgi:hypothetical protein